MTFDANWFICVIVIGIICFHAGRYLFKDRRLSGMPDREKVIKGLECCAGQCNYHGCPYKDPCENANGVKQIMLDAIALLKEQEEQKHSETFIVIDNKTGEEADMYNIALHEEWAQHLCYCDMEGWAIEDDGTLLLVDECGRFAYADRERFKVKWE